MPKISAKEWHRSMNSWSMFIENWEYWNLEKEATRLHQGEIGGLKERCRKIEQEGVRTDRKWQSVHEQLQKIPELERELRASNQRIANLERKLTEQDNFPSSPRTHSQQLVEKVALMEKRLKEAGISTEQLGQHELVKEIHRIQFWIHSLNGGWSNTPPENWKNPIPILENRCIELQAQYEKVQAEIQRVQSTRTQSSPFQSTRTQSVPIQSNPIQVNWIHFSPMGINPIPIQWTPIELDQCQ